MSFKQRPPDNTPLSIGCDPNTNSSKRNSGLFAFLKWFKPSASRESIDADPQISHSSSCDSLNSSQSAGTVASFSFIPPGDYKNCVSEKCIAPGPETDTYKARLKQRDKTREKDKNLTLRKKYNLFFNRDSLLKPKLKQEEVENSKSLPLMTKGAMMESQEEANKVHRRTNSESSKVRRAGAYVHVKGKRKAPQPPGHNNNQEQSSTNSLRRRNKRLAPSPPSESKSLKSNNTVYEEMAIISNDSLKLDHGILKSVKESDIADQNSTTESPSTTRSSVVDAPVSPRAWYKRNITKKDKVENKYEQIVRFPEVPFSKNSSLDLTLDDVKIEKKKEEKRKSGMTFLTNISELDREACEIVKNKEHEAACKSNLNEIPEFMRPKNTKDAEEWVSPKRRSARDLIAKFNAITSVKKVNVFGGSHKDKHLEKQISLDDTKRRQELILEDHKKRLEEIDNKKLLPLMKSESASAVKSKKKTPKMERKSWICPKCNIDNDYWRIICHVCSTIKPYFDDFSSSSKLDNNIKENNPPKKTDIHFERSKTQIGFSALLNYNNNNNNINKFKGSSSGSDEKVDQHSKREEKEKLKKMLIEMKNSLPKRKSNIAQRKNNTSSIILENPEDLNIPKTKEISKPNNKEDSDEKEEKTQEEKISEILIGTTTTVYENIKVKKTENAKPLKVSSSAQTTAAIKPQLPASTISKLVADQRNKQDFELMQVKDFENIYSQSSQSAAKMYANLVRNDELSLFFNIPKNVTKRDEKSARNLTRTDSLQINRLLKKLEFSISKGELTESSNIARELALLKVNCSVVRHKTLASREKTKKIQIEMYVEDKISHRGPFPVDVIPDQTLEELKNQVEKEFEIPVAYQRWILGKELVTDDKARLKDHGITTEGCPVFLYLVAPEKLPDGYIKKLCQDLEAVPSTSREINVDKNIETKVRINGNPSSSVPDKNSSNIKLEYIPPKISNPFKDRLEPKFTEGNGRGHAPKIVNVIPKITELLITPPTSDNIDRIKSEKEETSPAKIEIKQQSPPKIEIKSKKEQSPTEIESKQIPKLLSPFEVLKVEIRSTHIPTTVIETMKVEMQSNQKPSTSSQKAASTLQTSVTTTTIEDNSSETKYLPSAQPPDPALEVKPIIQHVFPTIQNSYQSEIKSEGPKLTVQSSTTPPKAKEEEDLSDYESKTLTPPKEWECHLCTLLNPVRSNICAVCSTIRVITKRQQTTKDNKQEEINNAKIKTNTEKASNSKAQTYYQLLNLDNTDLIENTDSFTCLVCFLEIPPKDGVTLRECLHQFCKHCLSQTIEFSDEAEVKCPYRDENYACTIGLQDREIKSLVTATVYEQHLAKSVAQAENKIDNSFHCKTPDCKGWCVYEDNVNEFKCPVCRRTNCLTCQAIHTGMNCRQFQEKIKDDANLDEDGKKTKEMLEEMVKKGEAIECPTCRVILMKKWGCDWLRCSMCKTEICWVTRGPRWGPLGKGDISGGCQCGVNGVKCHPKCNYCH